jgi:hypothetical protein
MIPAGYMYKQVMSRPDWLKDGSHVVDIYSLSECISPPFADYINHWRHNGFWLFDDPKIMRDIAQKNSVDLDPMALLYYEAYEQEYSERGTGEVIENGTWTLIEYSDFPTNVAIPTQRRLMGFDVVCHVPSLADPGCSPLSCNSVAETVAVNRHCLFDTFEQAKAAIDAGHFTGSEPGSLRIFAVYTVEP